MSFNDLEPRAPKRPYKPSTPEEQRKMRLHCKDCTHLEISGCGRCVENWQNCTPVLPNKQISRGFLQLQLRRRRF